MEIKKREEGENREERVRKKRGDISQPPTSLNQISHW